MVSGGGLPVVTHARRLWLVHESENLYYSTSLPTTAVIIELYCQSVCPPTRYFFALVLETERLSSPNPENGSIDIPDF